MTCTPIDFGNGVTGHACSRGQRRAKCRFCARSATRQCDFRLKGSKAGKTCDANLCDAHAVMQHVVERKGEHDTVDYCRPHDELAKQQAQLPGVE